MPLPKDDHHGFTAIARATAVAGHLKNISQVQQNPQRSIKFVYKPLNAEENGIRLVRIYPGPASQDVVIDIFHVAIDGTHPNYEALSYAWGSDEKNYTVRVYDRDESRPGFSGRPTAGELSQLAVSQNLSSALQNLRSTTKPRVIWVDAICINQEDLEERSKEVGKMGTIYRMAARVLVWLGDATSDSALALSALKSIGTDIEFDESEGNGNISFHAKPGLKVIENSSNAWRRDILKWMAIRNLLNRAWFTRLWVVQEIGHALKAIVIVGQSQLKWNAFRKAVFWIIQMSEENTPLGQVFDANYLHSIEPLISQNLGRSIESLLDLTKTASCYDPRDRIYALLSLLRAEDPMAIVPNYHLPAEDVYKAVVLRQLHVVGGFRLIGLCRFSNPASELKLPSWVPDLSVPNRLGLIRHSESSGGSKQETAYDKSNGSKLRVRGYIACCISNVSTPIPLDAKLPEIQAICHVWEPTGASIKDYLAGGTLLGAFIRTLFFGIASELRDFEQDINYRELFRVYSSAVVQGRAIGASGFYSTRFLQSHLPGRAFFRTEEGYIGLCPASASAGDSVFIALGCKTPVLIRRANESDDEYQVGGDCYVHGLMAGEALLGLLPSGWRSLWLVVRGEWRQVFVNHQGLITQLDPRAGDFPQNWQVRFKHQNDTVATGDQWSKNETFEISENDGVGLREPKFENTKTGESTAFDPRLRSDNLKARGVAIRELVFV